MVGASFASSALLRLEDLFARSGLLSDKDRRHLEELKERFFEKRFHVAVLGQFKRGKSTFLNAICGEKVLPTSVVPLTSVPTFLQFGDRKRAKVYFLDGRFEEFFGDADSIRNFISRYVTEEKNPKNKLNVSKVEIEYPSKILSDGFVLIDTPGIGSTFSHNTETTLNFLQSCDACLFMISPDPPIGELELKFLSTVSQTIPHIIFVMNKIDYLQEDEVKASINFTRKVLEENNFLTSGEKIFAISAKKALISRIEGREEIFFESGMDKLYGYLIKEVKRRKDELLEKAVLSKIRSFVLNLISQVRLRKKALCLPLLDLQNRLELFEEKMDEIEREKAFFFDILVGDRKRMSEFLENQAKDLREEAMDVFSKEIKGLLDRKEVDIQKEVASIFDKMPSFFEKKLEVVSKEFEMKITDLFSSHIRRAQKIIDAVRDSAREIFEIPLYECEDSIKFSDFKRPYWVKKIYKGSIMSVPKGVFDIFLPKSLKKKKMIERYLWELRDIVSFNVENLRWTTLQNLDATFRKFKIDFSNSLDNAAQSIKSTIDLAISKKREGESETELEKKLLDEVEMELHLLLSKISTK